VGGESLLYARGQNKVLRKQCPRDNDCDPTKFIYNLAGTTNSTTVGQCYNLSKGKSEDGKLRAFSTTVLYQELLISIT